MRLSAGQVIGRVCMVLCLMGLGSGLGALFGLFAEFFIYVSQRQLFAMGISERTLIVTGMAFGAYAGLLFALYQFHPDSGNESY